MNDLERYFHTPGPDGKTPLEEAHDSTVAMGIVLLVVIVALPLALAAVLWWLL